MSLLERYAKPYKGNSFKIPAGLNRKSGLSILNTEKVLENLSDAFFLIDERMTICYLNKAAEKLVQPERQQIIGENVSVIFPASINDKFQMNYQRMLSEQTAVRFEAYMEENSKWYKIELYPPDNGVTAFRLQDIAEWKEIEQKLKETGNFDPLTGLYNRKKIEEKISELLDNKVAFTLLYVSLDHLKFINTLYNHKTGDELLKNATLTIQQMLPEGDEAGRLEGSEFVVIQTSGNSGDCGKLAEILCERLSQPVLLPDGQRVNISTSIGVVSCPWDAAGIEELLAYGEAAMREAKKHTGSSHVIFNAHMRVDLARRVLIECDLSGDLKELGFHFQVQPQIHTKSGELSGVEVLSRWNHPELGWISPAEFIAIAEEMGTIVHLTTHLLHEVFSYIRRREARYGRRIRTAINLTPSLLADQNFFDHFFRLLDQYGIPPELVEIEITENTELTYSEKTLQNLLACRTKGISIAIDDFGTGFSMLAYLTHFPINKIKLDKLFIQKIGYGEKSEGVLESLIQFVLSIGCDLVAEGIETPEEAVFLKERGCLVHQGYFYDCPMTTQLFEEKYLQKAGKAL
jgi:diguanylate cyclase (GGDEF)-like protein/PAS domain S-box-containing protein